MRRLNGYRSWLFIVFIFVVVFVQISLNLFLSYCGEHAQNVRKNKRKIEAKHTAILRKAYTERLRATQRTITALKIQLKQATSKENQRENSTEIEILRKQNAQLTSQVKKYEKLQKIVNAQEFSKFKSEASKVDYLKGDIFGHHHYAVTPFDSFTHAGIFSVLKEGLVDQPARRPIGARIKEQEEIFHFALRVLNDQLSGEQIFQRYNLVNGISRLNRITGMVYDLVFKSKPNQYHRVKIRRPFSNLELVDNVETLDTSQEIINLILPLSGRTSSFEIFLKRFGNICVRWDGNVYLTVVYFGKKGREKVKKLLSEFENREKFNRYKLIFQDGPFSRGAGLQTGVLSWEKGNNIMFFCDVDMFFTADFLERCRLYAQPGQMVYYPIVFSLYNPEIVYNGNNIEIEQQLRIGKYNGFWRDFGFGMTCVYKNDFVETKGFDTSIHGWGTEDVKLYKTFLKTNLAVIRATDRGIFHIYHQKKCDFSIPAEQYLSCLHSKAITEASHRQMGMLAFGNRLFSNMEPEWKTKLEYQPDFSLRDTRTKDKRAINLWRRADELDIEMLEVKQLRNRLTAAMNFTMFGDEIFDTRGVNMSSLRELQFGLANVTKVVRKLALEMSKNSTTHG